MFFGTDYLSAKSSRTSRRRSANAMFLTHLFLDSVKPVPSTKLGKGRTPSRIKRSKNSSLFVGKDLPVGEIFADLTAALSERDVLDSFVPRFG